MGDIDDEVREIREEKRGEGRTSQGPSHRSSASGSKILGTESGSQVPLQESVPSVPVREQVKQNPFLKGGSSGGSSDRLSSLALKGPGKGERERDHGREKEGEKDAGTKKDHGGDKDHAKDKPVERKKKAFVSYDDYDEDLMSF